MESDNDDQVWEIDVTEEPEEQEEDTITYQISNYPADLTLKGYVDKWEAGQLVIPPFQRGYVWDQVKASKLIESFLLGLPVPGVFLYKERATNKLQVIDGQQRILSAIRYFKNEFDERIFRLKKVNKRWEGNTYAELDDVDRFQLDDAVLRAVVVQQVDPQDDSSVYHIFERLNTGGINLNPMEVRKCVYFGDVFEALEESNAHSAWRQVLGKPVMDKRLRDVELVLRTWALADNWKHYEKPMKGFLNRYMAGARRREASYRQEFLRTKNQQFKKVCEAIVEQLGDKPFHLRGRLNYAVTDSVTSTLLANPARLPDDLSDRFEALLADAQYIEVSTINTSDERALQDRFRLAERYLLG